MIKRVHLEIVREVQRTGSLIKAVEKLCLTQSALSHSISKLELKLGTDIWLRDGRNVRLTPAGELLHDLACRILPDLEHCEHMLEETVGGKRGILRIGMECHPCYRWLQSVITPFLPTWETVDIDIKQQFQFDGLTALCNADLDLLVTPDPVPTPRIDFLPVFDYELVLVLADDHPHATRAFIKPEDLMDEILFTYPVSMNRLDIYNYFLNPAAVLPREQKTLESTEIMLQMVAAGRGVSALPRWLVTQYPEHRGLILKPLGKKGVFKKIYLGIHENKLDIEYIQEFISMARENSPPLSMA
jgi:LysR family transcriptional regulator for metE and metH